MGSLPDHPISPESTPSGQMPLTPEMLSEMLKVEAPSGPVLVQGVARELRHWGKGSIAYVFGRLALGRASIGFRTHPECAPSEGQAVMMNGVLQIQPGTKSEEDWRATHVVMLIGSVVGTWDPREDSEPVLKLPVRDERVPLAEFLSENRAENLLVLTTGTARADITRVLSDAGVTERPVFMEANFGSAAEFLGTIRQLGSQRDIAGIAVARGGGGGQDLIGGSREIISALIELDVPFYAAFGHATDVALIDMYADQAFHAPSGLGGEIARSVKEKIRRQIQDREYNEKVQLVEKLDDRLKLLENDLQRTAYVHRGGISFSWKVIAFAMAICAIFLALLFGLFPTN